MEGVVLMNKLLMAALDYYQAQRTEAIAHLDLLFNDAKAIGEHSDLLTEVKKMDRKFITGRRKFRNIKEQF